MKITSKQLSEAFKYLMIDGNKLSDRIKKANQEYKKQQIRKGLI